MENKESKKKEILDLLKRDVITTDEAIEMLNKLEVSSPSIVKWEKEEQKFTYKDMVDKITYDTVSDMDIDAVLKIMNEMNWTYGLSHEPVTRESVISCMKDNVRSAINSMVENHLKENWASATTRTGGFECRAWVDDDDWDNIQIELKFIPYSAFGVGHIEELIKLKKQEK